MRRLSMGRAIGSLLALIISAAASAALAAGAHGVAMRPSGGGGHAVAGGGHAVATRTAAPRATANGTARYGYGYGYGHGYYGGYYGGYYPGWYWGCNWGWPYYSGWYGGFYYGPYYGAYAPYGGWYGPTYVMSDTGPPSGPATVETDVSPGKAHVVLDGEEMGIAKDYDGRWDELHIEPGRHTIAFRKDGYRGLAVTFDAEPGAKYRFDQTLSPGEGEDHVERTRKSAEHYDDGAAPAAATSPAARGRLRVHASPGDASVYLDGEYLGLAGELGRLHGAIPVATGEHRLEFVRPGYASESRSVVVEGDAPATVEVELARQPG